MNSLKASRFLVGGKQGTIEKEGTRASIRPPCAVWGVLKDQELTWSLNIEVSDHPLLGRVGLRSERLLLQVHDGEPLTETLTAEIVLSDIDDSPCCGLFLDSNRKRFAIGDARLSLTSQSPLHTELELEGMAQLPCSLD